MPRGKKQIKSLKIKKGSQHKFIPVFFSNEEKHSPHLLNLPEKLTPPALPTWQPSELDRLLSNPLGDLNKVNKKTKEKTFAEKLDLKLDLPVESAWENFCNFLPKISLSKLPKKNPTQLIKKTEKKIPAISPIKLEYSTPRPISYSFPNWQKAFVSFAVMALILVLPIKAFSAYYQLRDSQDEIISSGTTAFEHLSSGQSALQQGEFGQAIQELQISLNSFAEAQNKLNTIHPVWRSLLYLTPKIGSKLKNGEELMLAGSNLTMGSLPILYLLTEKNQEEITLTKIKETLNDVAPRFAKTNESLMRVNPIHLPEENQQTFLKIRESIFLLNEDLQKINSLSHSLLTAAGVNEEKTYLIIFQNNNEIRATGGFIGSFAEIKIKNGQITKMYIPGEGSYALEGTLMAYLIPPAPLQLLQPRWEFRDANWFPDFPTSAKKLMWLYEKSGGPTLDGLIAIDTNPLVDLMSILGNVSLPEHDLEINSENFIDVIQHKVEIGYDKEKNQPKEVLSDLAPLILEKIFENNNNLLPLLSVINKNLSQKHIQFFFNDTKLQNEIISQGWGGEIKNNPNGDFLSIINTNIGGDKSDRVIEQKIQHQSKIYDDGTVINKIILTRTHLGSESIFSNVKNNSYVRFYVPQGSQLISAEGFEWPEETTFRAPETWYKMDVDLQKIEETQKIDVRNGTIITTESDKTVFANWMIVKPQETTQAIITYKLPFKITKPENQNWINWIEQFLKQNKNYSSYSLMMQKQAGSNKNYFSSEVSWPESWKVLWTNPRQITINNNQSFFSNNLLEDTFLGIVFENSSNQ